MRPAIREATSVYATMGSRPKSTREKERPPDWVVFLFLVDDIGLEPMTFRTSSGCSSQLS